MDKKISGKPLVYAFAAFIFLVVLTVTTSFYVRFELSQWGKLMFEEVTHNTSTLINGRFNSYKLSYYGLMNIYQKLYAEEPEIINVLNKDSQTREAFGKVRQVSGLMGEFDQLGQEHKDHAELAFLDNRPVFFNVESGSENYMGVILPVSISDRKFIYSEIYYEDIFLPVSKTSILDGLDLYTLNASVIDNSDSSIVFTSSSENTHSFQARKFSNLNPDVVVKVYLDEVELNLEFKQEIGSSLVIWIKQIPFTILVAGIILSVSIFGVVFFGMVSAITEKEKNL